MTPFAVNQKIIWHRHVPGSEPQKVSCVVVKQPRPESPGSRYLVKTSAGLRHVQAEKLEAAE